MKYARKSMVVAALAVFALLISADIDKVAGAIDQWARAWEKAGTSFDAYKACYDPAFQANYKAKAGMNYGQWMADKQGKVKKAKCIKVTVSNLKINFPTADTAVATFTQKYSSDSYCDFGTKTLYLVSRGGSWKIVGEEQPQVTKCEDRCGSASPGGPAVAPPLRPFSGEVYNETIGGVGLGSPLSEVVKRYGQPEKTEPFRMMEATGEYQGSYTYSSRGIMVYFSARNRDGKGATVSGIVVDKPGIYTGSGIGVGSPSADVRKAYPKAGVDGDNLAFKENTDCGSELGFAIAGGKVKHFSLYSATCE